MDEPDIRALLIGLKISTHKVTYTGSKKRARWMNISCPFAPWTHDRGSDANPSFGVTIDPDGRSFYKCLACGIHGRLAALPTKLGGYRNKNYSELRHWAELTEIQAGRNRPIPDWEDSIVDDEATDRSNAPSSRLVRSYPLAIGVPYLRARGITLPTVYRAGLRFDTYQHRVLFPCYDKYRTFRGFTGRSIRPGNDTTKGRNPKVRDYYGLSKRELFLGLPSYPEERGPRIISEGLFEFARGIENGYPATRAILGTSLTEEKVDILIEEAAPVYFFMDNDLAGWAALFGRENEDGTMDISNAWAFRLYEEIPVWIVPYPRPFDGTDPGGLNRKQWDAAVNQAWIFTGRPPTDDLGLPTFERPRM